MRVGRLVPDWLVECTRECTRGPEATPTTGRRTLWRNYPRTTALAVLGIILFTGIDAALTRDYWRHRREVARLRDGMTDAERRHADLILATEQHRLRVTLELVRRQARGDHDLHLAVSIDSGRMYLEQDGIVLREMPVRVGAERLAGDPPDTVRLVAPRGARTVVRLLSARDRWDVPRWVFADRQLPVPDERKLRGAFGSQAILLSGGAVIYSRPETGPLADSAYVLPGAVLVGASDLRAIGPNLIPGMSVYFY